MMEKQTAIAMGVEPEDIYNCKKCGAAVMPWYIICEGILTEC